MPQSEQTALRTLVRYLGQVEEDASNDESEPLDDSSRAYLHSYRDQFTRISLIAVWAAVSLAAVSAILALHAMRATGPWLPLPVLRREGMERSWAALPRYISALDHCWAVHGTGHYQLCKQRLAIVQIAARDRDGSRSPLLAAELDKVIIHTGGRHACMQACGH